MQKLLLGGIVAALALATPAAALAQETFLLEAAGSAAAPINDTYRDQYSAGAIGDLGLYHSLAPVVLIGIRGNGGFLGENSDTGTRGDTKLGSANGALRLRPLARRSDPRRSTGLWLEGAGGAGIMQSELRPMLSPGLGYTFDTGSGVGIGPAARYIHVFDPPGFGGEDAQIGTLGVEVMFFDNRGRGESPSTHEFQPSVPESTPMVPAARVEGDADGDGILDSRDQCPNQPETYNGINDHDGCPDTALEFINDRLVVDERIFFDFDQATLRPSGQEKLRELAALYGRSGYDWKTLRVQGHADERGPAAYNVELSARRAETVKRFLSSEGLPDGMIDVEAYGESRPAIPGAKTEAEHQVNRRVEFVIEHKK
jgi:outer membrane protein OmpA-like peptidoglycan-associated protein